MPIKVEEVSVLVGNPQESIFVKTDLLSPSGIHPLVLEIVCSKGVGVEYSRKAFGIEPNVIDINLEFGKAYNEFARLQRYITEKKD